MKVGLEAFVAEGPALVREVAQRLRRASVPGPEAPRHPGDRRRRGRGGGALRAPRWSTSTPRAAARCSKRRGSAARRAPGSRELIAVTLLTSLDAKTLADLPMAGQPEGIARRLAVLAKECGLDGVVCSADGPGRRSAPRAARISSRSSRGSAPRAPICGIRSASRRPRKALAAGADLLVIGRPSPRRPDPDAALGSRSLAEDRVRFRPDRAREHDGPPMSDWKEPHPTWIVGHRGAPRRARENTIASFDFAESFGADAVEFDLRQTPDGEAVVFHDDDIVLGTQRIPVRSFTWREIEKLVIPSELGEYRIPRLEQVFHRYGTALRYVVEVKTSPGMQMGTMARRIAKLASAFGARPTACLVGIVRRRVPEAHARGRPGASPTSYIFDHPVALPGPGPADAALSAGRRHRAAQGPREPDASLAGRDGQPLRPPWTVDEADEIRKLLAAGVASITTNAPDVALEIRSGTEVHETGLAYPRRLKPQSGGARCRSPGCCSIGVLAGVFAGMFGIGGGLIIVPALAVLYGMKQHAAVGTSLGALLLPVGALSAWVYWKNGNVNVKYSVLLAAGLLVGASSAPSSWSPFRI